MSKKKIGAVILSRFSSSRLPGKALMEIQGKVVLQHIIDRLATVMEKQDIVIATSVEDSDDPIAAFAKSTGIECYRGSLENVAERFFDAANANDWDFAMRINGDNVFVDTDVLSQMINIANEGDYNFISNVKNRTFPKGMSIEIVKMNYYKQKLPFITASAHYREHVTLYLYENEDDGFYYYFNTTLPEAAGLQFALDTKDDLERTRAIIKLFEKNHATYNLKEIYEIYQTLERWKIE